MIPARIHAFARMRARFGWQRTTHVALLWLLRQSLGYREAVIFCLDLEAVTAPPICDEFMWGYTPLSEIEPGVLAAAGLDRSALEACVRNNRRCFAGKAGAEVCYLSIVSISGFTVPERLSVQFDPSGADAYVGDCFTLERYRGQGVYPCALLQLGVALRAEGRRRLYLFVERENLASIRSVEKAGFQRVAVCHVLKWRGSVKQRWRILDERAGVAGTLRTSRVEPLSC